MVYISTYSNSLLLYPHYTSVLVHAGESTCGQRALYELGMTGIPIYNVSTLHFSMSF